VTERLEYLRKLLKAREGKHEYRDNVVAIRAEIARIEQELSNGE
jgi:hypothetical protein